ncbi:MAG: hypothetical protein AB7V77_01585 [Candidatus Woesearchaeota archaeon]
MDFFSYIITTFVAFVGLFLGLLLAKISPDEAHEFKKYIPCMQLFLMVMLYLVLFKYLPTTIAVLFTILSFLFIFMFWRKRDINTLDYIIFSVVFVLTSTNNTAHYYVTAIIFSFGLLAGTLFYVLHDKPKLHKINHGHHKHSGKQLTFIEMSNELFYKYLFFVIFALVNLIIALIFSNFV